MSRWNHFTKRAPVVRLLGSLVDYKNTESIHRDIHLCLEGDILTAILKSSIWTELGRIDLSVSTIRRPATNFERWIINTVYEGASHIVMEYGHHALHVKSVRKHDAWCLADFYDEVGYVWKKVCYQDNPV